MSDPFAVSDYPLRDLPDACDLERANFQTAGGYGRLWISFAGGERAAVQLVKRSYGPLKERKAHVEHMVLDEIGGWRRDFVSKPLEFRHALERKLALTTIIDEMGGEVPRELMKALIAALGIQTKCRKRAAGYVRAMDIGRLLAKGMSVSRTVRAAKKALFAGRYVDEKTVWNIYREPSVSRHVDRWRAYFETNEQLGDSTDFLLTESPHAADEWFNGGNEERVARAIIERIRKEGRASLQARWDVFNLVEGYKRRGKSLPAFTRIALDYSLGLVDGQGHPAAGVQLGGIAERDAFMALVREAVSNPHSDNRALFDAVGGRVIELPDESTLTRWLKKPIFKFAVASSRSI